MRSTRPSNRRSARHLGALLFAALPVLALANADVLIYCKSGTRSAFLWALARARQGADVDDLVSQAAQAGYDLRPILPWLDAADVTSILFDTEMNWGGLDGVVPVRLMVDEDDLVQARRVLAERPL